MRWFLLLVAAGACLVAAGCDNATQREGTESGADPFAAAAAELVPATAADVLAAVREPGARAVLVNVWATWCMPCREEFPDILRVYREQEERGFRLILVSGDFDSQLPAAQAFLGEQGVDFPSFLKQEDDMKFINTLSPEWTGALPATFLYDGGGNLRDFWEGKASYETLMEKVTTVLNENDNSNLEERG
jgi:thiol-disulfide isomerase/thioredoxin